MQFLRKYWLHGVVSLLLVITLVSLATKLAAGGQAFSPDPLSSPGLKNISSNFDTTANISYKGLNASATITQSSPDACTIAFTQPKSLKDMAFRFSKDEIKVTYKGLGFGINPASLPGSAVAKMAVNTLGKALQREGIGVDFKDGALAVSGEADAGSFQLLLDPETGNFLKLSIPGQELEIEFENFRFLQ